MALIFPTTVGVLTADAFGPYSAVTLNGPAWAITDHRSLMRLWTPQTIRGSNILVPLTSGVTSTRSRHTVTEISFGMTIIGECNLAGTVNANTWEGLQQNILYLSRQLIAPGVERPVSFATPGGETLVGSMQFDQLILGDSIEGHDEGQPYYGAACLATLKVRLRAPLRL